MKSGSKSTYAPPCQDLYIYLIKGVPDETKETLLGPAFMGNWVEEGSSFLFFSRPAPREVSDLLDACPDLEMEDHFHFSYEDWQGGGLAPLVLEPFLIVPPWFEGNLEKGLIPLVLDPGVVFGNCLHPTTRACMRAISRVMGKTPFNRVLDLGTGTGILALAAARLGAREVLAVDLNPLCVKTAANNVKLNQLEQTIQAIQARAEEVIDPTADLIVANIHYDVIKEILEKGAFRKTATLLISGLLRSQCSDIKTRLERAHVYPLYTWDHDLTWFTVLAARDATRRD